MNPKIALFLSTALTAFVVATLSGVVNKVTSVDAENDIAPTQVVVVEQVAAATLEEPTDQPTATAQAPLGPEKAAALAAEAIKSQDVYSVETSTYNGVEAYKVIFSSGAVVYIGLDSQVLTTTKLQPVVVVNVEPTVKPRRIKNNTSNNSGSSQPSTSGGGGGDDHGDDHGEDHGGEDGEH